MANTLKQGKKVRSSNDDSAELVFYLQKVSMFSRILFRGYLFFAFCATVLIITLLTLDTTRIFMFRSHSIALVGLALGVFLVVFTFPMSVLFYCVSGICNFMLGRKNELFSYITPEQKNLSDSDQ